MRQKIDFDIIVIGGGIVGLASAYKITQQFSDISVALLEKEEHLATHQTGHNSGVIHSGLYYKPGSNKAKTCISGRKQLIDFAEKYDIAHEICGKIIVATKVKEMVRLDHIFRRGQENHIEGIEKIEPDQIRQAEPFCEALAGIRVPGTGIIDFKAVAEKLGELIEEKQGGSVFTSHKVEKLEKHDFFTKVITNREAFNVKYIINCAGLASDRIARMDNVEAMLRIVPFRGDYYDLTKEAAEKIKNLIYPVPDPAFPFLGVHFTRRLDGKVECGPNAVFSFKREGYSKMDFDLKDTWESLSYPGLWKMFLRHWRYGLGEYARAFSKKLFVRQLQRLVPSLTAEDITPGNSGVRAQAVGFNGEPIGDFRVEARGNAIHVLNAPSPAATASLAIGDYISRLAGERFDLKRGVNAS